MSDGKVFYKSKSIWAGAITVVVFLLSMILNAAESGGLPTQWEPYAGLIAGVATIALRLVTQEPIVTSED